MILKYPTMPTVVRRSTEFNEDEVEDFKFWTLDSSKLKLMFLNV